jgi:hypothetical protein
MNFGDRESHLWINLIRPLSPDPVLGRAIPDRGEIEKVCSPLFPGELLIRSGPRSRNERKVY